MIVKLGSGWQTVTADLALILFLVTAQHTLVAPADPASPTSAEAPPPVEGSGVAIFRPGSGLDLSRWLAETLTDDRQSVTATVRFAPGTRDAALVQADELLRAIERTGASPRLVLEPAAASETLVVIGFESAPAAAPVYAPDGTQLADTR